MINALLIESSKTIEPILLQRIREYCPEVNFIAKTPCCDMASRTILNNDADVVFLPFEKIQYLNQFPPASFEVICIGDNRINAFDAIKHNAVGFLVPPFTREDLILCLNNVSRRLRNKKEMVSSENFHNNLLGIPTIEGLEFFTVKNIVRCEGYQKCTKMIILDKKRIISSYNIGEFRKILSPHNFFMAHKSHLINLQHIRKYNKEGTITMADGQGVPLARRKKGEFLKHVFHL